MSVLRMRVEIRGLRLFAVLQCTALQAPAPAVASAFNESGAWDSAPFSTRH